MIVFTIASGHRAISGAQASSPAASERFSPVSASAAPWRLHENGGGLALEDLIVGGRGSVASQVRKRADRDNVQGQAASTAATCAPAACSRPSRARWRSSREEGCENGASSWASSRRLLRGASERKRAVDANSHTPEHTHSRSWMGGGACLAFRSWPWREQRTCISGGSAARRCGRSRPMVLAPTRVLVARSRGYSRPAQRSGRALDLRLVHLTITN